MGMKATELDATYRALHESTAVSALRHVYVGDHPHLGYLETSIAPGVTVLCGASGVGKSQFLKALAAHLADGDHSVVTTDLCDLYGATPPASHDVMRRRAKCQYVDLARECFDILQQTSSPDLPDRLESAEPLTLEEEVVRLRYVLGRDYSKAELREVSRNDGRSEHWRHFTLHYGGRSYGPAEMSLGELAACVILTLVQRAGEGQILLLDEPENFLSPRARAHLLDVIATRAVKRKLSVVIASHSAEFVARLPASSLRVMERSVAEIHVDAADYHSAAVRALGLDPLPRVLALVEDDLAVHLLETIIAIHAPRLIGQVRAAKVGGDGKVDLGVKVLGQKLNVAMDSRESRRAFLERGVRTLAKHELGVRVIGVLDGDARQQFNGDHLAYLPGDHAPEALLLQALRACPDLAAERLGVSRHALDVAVAGAEGLDHHHQPEHIARTINYDTDTVTAVAVRIAVGMPEHKASADELVTKLTALLSPHP